MKKILVFVFFIGLTSCGYFENDGVIWEKQIIGNFGLFESGSGPGDIQLVFSYPRNSYFIIIQNCKKVFYDSAHKKIYVESILNQYINNYDEVDILSAESISSIHSHNKRQIEKNRFDSLITNVPLIFEKKG